MGTNKSNKTTIFDILEVYDTYKQICGFFNAHLLPSISQLHYHQNDLQIYYFPKAYKNNEYRDEMMNNNLSGGSLKKMHTGQKNCGEIQIKKCG